MTPERYEQVKKLFHELAELSPQQRQAQLDELAAAGDENEDIRAELDSLLVHLERPTTPALITSAERRSGATGDALVGRTIGNYRVLDVIGRGGMGVVYRAEQEQPRRLVALKVIHPGVASPAMIRRFEQESEILGRLQHPCIARVFEAGTFDSGAGPQPYFAMEFIDGLPLTAYAALHNLGTRRRLEVMVKIGKAIHHAHQKAIIHRDLKPGNILVDGSGEPNILDFGVARTTDGDIQTTMLRTDIGQLIGTLPYMSPEQVAGNPDEIDTRSDVYALGVICYELLAGRLPYDVDRRAMHEVARVIQEDDPTPLSMHHRTFRGDLATIVAKALAKEKERRYQSALEFAADVERYLNNEPIVARPTTAWYQLSKFSRRHKALVGGVAATFVALLAGLAATTLLYLHAEQARQDAVAARRAEVEQRLIAENNEHRAIEEAERAARKAERALLAEAEAARWAQDVEQLAEFHASRLSTTSPSRFGAMIRREILAQVKGHDEQDTASRVSDMEIALAEVNFTTIAVLALNENIIAPTLAAAEEQFAAQPLVLARLLQSTATEMRSLGMYEQALKPQEQALAIRRRDLGGEHPDTLASINSMGRQFQRQGRLREAEPYLLEALEIRRRTLGEEHRDTLTSMNNLGGLLRHQGRFEEAEPYFRRVLEGRRRVLGEEHRDTLSSLNNLGALLRSQGRIEESERSHRETMELRRRVLGDTDVHTLNSIHNLAIVLRELGRLDEAEPLLREALDGYRRILGDEHPSTLGVMNSTGRLLIDRRKYTEAEHVFREVMQIRRRVLGDEHAATLTSINNSAFALKEQGRLPEAEPLFREAMEGRRRALGEEHPDTLNSINNIAGILEAQGKFAEAELYWRDALKGRRRVLGGEHPDTLRSINNMGAVLRTQGRLAEAEGLYREALDGRRRTLGSEHPDTVASLTMLSGVLRDLHRFDESEALLIGAIDQVTDALGEGHHRTRGVQAALAQLYDLWHDAEPEADKGAKAAKWRARLAATDRAEVNEAIRH